MKSRLLITIAIVGIGIASAAIYFPMSSHLDSYSKNVFCGEDLLRFFLKRTKSKY